MPQTNQSQADQPKGQTRQIKEPKSARWIFNRRLKTPAQKSKILGRARWQWVSVLAAALAIAAGVLIWQSSWQHSEVLPQLRWQCTPCGNDNCDSQYGENRCNCPEDCVTVENLLHASVIDKTTAKPIKDAIVYLGTGAAGKCDTNNEGKCSVKFSAGGDYGVGAFKKGYNRSQIHTHLEEGDNFITIELEKKSEIPSSFTIEGIVTKVIAAEGTKSGYSYYKIRDNDGNEEYLFDDIGISQGFEEFVDKKVRITGFKEIGFIGWMFTETQGIYVEKIGLR